MRLRPDDHLTLLANRAHREIARMTKALKDIAFIAAGPIKEEAEIGLQPPMVKDAWQQLLSDLKHLDASLNRIADMDPGDDKLNAQCVEEAKAARFYAGTRFKGAA